MDYSLALIYGTGLACLLAWFLYRQAGRELSMWPFQRRHKLMDDTLLALIITVSILCLLVLILWALPSIPPEPGARGWQPPLNSRPHWLE